MADDPNPALRAELKAAMAILQPQIRGLHYLVMISGSDLELVATLNEQIVIRERRRDLIQRVLDNLDVVLGDLRSLEADGYPDLDVAFMEPNPFGEMQQENNDIDAAVAVFKRDDAAKISIGLGTPVVKTQP